MWMTTNVIDGTVVLKKNPCQLTKTRGYSQEFLSGLCPVLQTLTPFQTKKISDYSHSFSELTSKKLCHHFLHQNQNRQQQQKIFLKSISYLHMFLSYSFGLEKSTFIHSRVVPLEERCVSEPGRAAAKKWKLALSRTKLSLLSLALLHTSAVISPSILKLSSKCFALHEELYSLFLSPEDSLMDRSNFGTLSFQLDQV